ERDERAHAESADDHGTLRTCSDDLRLEDRGHVFDGVDVELFLGVHTDQLKSQHRLLVFERLRKLAQDQRMALQARDEQERWATAPLTEYGDVRPRLAVHTCTQLGCGRP